MNILIMKKYYTVEECKNNPNKLYVFGDNTKRYGKGGQAIIRDCNNSIGIATKISPSMDKDSFFIDCNEHQEIVRTDFNNLITESKKYKTIVFPKDGIGTGLANMKENSPQLFKNLCHHLENTFGFNNGQIEVNISEQAQQDVQDMFEIEITKD